MKAHRAASPLGTQEGPRERSLTALGMERLEDAAASHVPGGLSFGAKGNQTQRSTYYRVSQASVSYWVLQLLFRDLPALLPHANLWPVPLAEDTGSWHTTTMLRNPNLLGGMGMIESCPGRSPRQLEELQAGVWSDRKLGQKL